MSANMYPCAFTIDHFFPASYLDHNNFSSIELTPLFGLVELQQL